MIYTVSLNEVISRNKDKHWRLMQGSGVFSGNWCHMDQMWPAVWGCSSFPGPLHPVPSSQAELSVILRWHVSGAAVLLSSWIQSVRGDGEKPWPVAVNMKIYGTLLNKEERSVEIKLHWALNFNGSQKHISCQHFIFNKPWRGTDMRPHLKTPKPLLYRTLISLLA